jgi:hypothetical protein
MGKFSIDMMFFEDLKEGEQRLAEMMEWVSSCKNEELKKQLVETGGGNVTGWNEIPSDQH